MNDPENLGVGVDETAWCWSLDYWNPEWKLGGCGEFELNIREDQTEAFAKEVEGFLGGTEGKESAYSAGNPSIPGLGTFLGEGNGWPTPVFLLGESHEHRSLAGYSQPDRKESDMTERLSSSRYRNVFLFSKSNTLFPREGGVIVLLRWFIVIR